MSTEYVFESTENEVTTPLKEVYRAVYRRRGSDLIFAATEDGKIQVTRVSHRYKTAKYFVHQADALVAKLQELKEYLDAGGYKAVETGPVADKPTDV